MQPASGAQWRPRVVARAVDGAFGVAYEDGDVVGRGVAESSLVGVVYGVDAGGDLVGVDLRGEAVQELEDLVGRQVEAGVGAYGGAELAHDGRCPYAPAHDVADHQRCAAGAEGDDVVPVAADGRVRAAGLVCGGDAQVVGLLQLLGQQAALEGDGGLALAALAGAQALGGLDLVGDVGGEDQHAAVTRCGERGAGEGVVAVAGARAAVARHLAGLDRAGRAAAQDLVHERQQAQLDQLGQGLAGRRSGGPGSEDRGVGVVDEADPVVGAVDDGGERGHLAEQLVHGQCVDAALLRVGFGPGAPGAFRALVVLAGPAGLGVPGAPDVPGGLRTVGPLGARAVACAGDCGGVLLVAGLRLGHHRACRLVGAVRDRGLDVDEGAGVGVGGVVRRLLGAVLARGGVGRGLLRLYRRLGGSGAPLCAGQSGAPAREVHVVRFLVWFAAFARSLRSLCCALARGRVCSGFLCGVTLRRRGPTHRHTSSVAHRADIRQTPLSGGQFRAGPSTRAWASPRARRQFELGAGVFQGAEGDDFPLEEAGEHPFGEHP